MPPFLFGEERRTEEVAIKKLVFSVQEFYESSAKVEFCNRILNEFSPSLGEKSERMDSINFHLLRHLAWQVKFMGPLFTTSAFMFESANRMVIAPLTGTVNQCQLMVDRFIRSKFVAKKKVEKDCLAGILQNFQQHKTFDNVKGFVESSETLKFRIEYSGAKLSCR